MYAPTRYMVFPKTCVLNSNRNVASYSGLSLVGFLLHTLRHLTNAMREDFVFTTLWNIFIGHMERAIEMPVWGSSYAKAEADQNPLTLLCWRRAGEISSL